MYKRAGERDSKSVAATLRSVHRMRDEAAANSVINRPAPQWFHAQSPFEDSLQAQNFVAHFGCGLCMLWFLPILKWALTLAIAQSSKSARNT
jgi:hypothetical protein